VFPTQVPSGRGSRGGREDGPPHDGAQAAIRRDRPALLSLRALRRVLQGASRRYLCSARRTWKGDRLPASSGPKGSCHAPNHRAAAIPAPTVADRSGQQAAAAAQPQVRSCGVPVPTLLVGCFSSVRTAVERTPLGSSARDNASLRVTPTPLRCRSGQTSGPRTARRRLLRSEAVSQNQPGSGASIARGTRQCTGPHTPASQWDGALRSVVMAASPPAGM
jgi:hypothetical protein